MKLWCWQHVALCLTAQCAIAHCAGWHIATSNQLFSLPAVAQIVPDATLRVNSIVTPNGNTLTIDGGSRAGGNLFHSFQEFSLPTGSEAFFNNPVDIQNIFSRVTGGNISRIDGLIRANGSANLFLLNPSGIVFGSNARLNIGGSFFGTTANSIRFADGVEFSATNPSTTPLLTVSVPIGLQMGQNPKGITVEGWGHQLTTTHPSLAPYQRSQPQSGLQVKPNQTLALVGGDIAVIGGVLTAPQGQVTLGSIGFSDAGSVVGLQPIPQGWNLDYSTSPSFGNIALNRAALLDASSNGTIRLQGHNISLKNGSLAFIQNTGNTSTGGIEVNATGWLSMVGTPLQGLILSGLDHHTMGTGNGGDIRVSAAAITITEGAKIRSIGFGSGATGNVIVNVTGSIQVRGFFLGLNANSGIGTYGFGVGDNGYVQVSANQLTITDGGYVASATFGRGYGGNVSVDVADAIEVEGANPISQSVSTIGAASFGAGNAGIVRVNVGRLSIYNLGRVTSGAFAQGNAGDTTVNATQLIEISDPRSSIDSSVDIIPAAARAAFGLPDIPSGKAGSVTVNTPTLRIGNQGQVSVRNEGSGNAGQLQINADAVVLDRQGAITASTTSGIGGNIILNLQNSLMMRNNGLINTEAKDTGNGGNITIYSPVIIGLENSDIIANAVQGNGGNIQIHTQAIFGLQNRPQATIESDITASSQFGLSGAIAITNPEIETRSFLVNLPQNLIDADRQITAGCAANRGNTFTVAGRGGLPEDPSQGILGRAIWWDDRDLSADGNTAVLPEGKLTPSNPVETIQEATGWMVNAQGEVELVAQKPQETPWYNVASCQNMIPR